MLADFTSVSGVGAMGWKCGMVNGFGEIGPSNYKLTISRAEGSVIQMIWKIYVICAPIVMLKQKTLVGVQM